MSDDRTVEMAIFDKFGKSGFLLGLRAVIARHPTWAPEASEAMSEGIALALTRERQSRAVVEQGFRALFGQRRVLRVSPERRRYIRAGIEALSTLGGTLFQKRALEAVDAGEETK